MALWFWPASVKKKEPCMLGKINLWKPFWCQTMKENGATGSKLSKQSGRIGESASGPFIRWAMRNTRLKEKITSLVCKKSVRFSIGKL